MFIYRSSCQPDIRVYGRGWGGVGVGGFDVKEEFDKDIFQANAAMIL